MTEAVIHNITDAPQKLEESFNQEGYLLIKDCFSADECNNLMARMHDLIDDYDPNEQRTFFSATGDQSHATEEYFRTSGDKIRFFLEKDSIDAKGKLINDKHASINKVGHALHDLDSQFSAFSRAPQLAKVVSAIGIVEPLLVQSMYIFKPPKIGGEVNCHQDSTFIYTEPQTCIGLWIALEDATIENGCLWAAPGGHVAPLRERFQNMDGDLGMKTLDETPMPEVSLPLVAKQGTLVVLHGRLPHQSSPNTSTKSRHAYAVHVIDGKANYPKENWLQRSADMPMRGF